MLNKLWVCWLVVILAGCSEPVEPPLATKQPDESGVFPPLTVPSETHTLTIWVAAEKRQCMAVGPTECLQIRHNPNEDWQLFHGDIVGFDYQPGQLYQLEVSEVLIPEPPADAPDRQWVLRQIISSSVE